MKRKKFVYIALGDSTAEGYGASKPERSYPAILFDSLKEAFQHAHYHNFGKRDATVKDVLDHQLEKTITVDPSLVTISVGANDISKWTKLGAFEKRLNILFYRLTKETSAKIVMNTIPDYSSLPAMPKAFRFFINIFIRRFNRKITKLADRYQVTLVDLYQQSSSLVKQFPESIFTDGLHPSDFGYELWANTILSHIRPLIFSEG